MTGQHALVVDDNFEIARLMKLILQELGFTPAVVTNGEEALQFIQETPPELVLLDLNIPKISGVEVLRRIRANDHQPPIKVIVVSANPHMIEGLADMADLVLQKPISYTQLRDLIRRIL